MIEEISRLIGREDIVVNLNFLFQVDKVEVEVGVFLFVLAEFDCVVDVFVFVVRQLGVVKILVEMI